VKNKTYHTVGTCRNYRKRQMIYTPNTQIRGGSRISSWGGGGALKKIAVSPLDPPLQIQYRSSSLLGTSKHFNK